MKCLACQSYFRRNEWNSSDYCEKCLDSDPDLDYNPIDDDFEIHQLLHPSGKTEAKFYD